VKKISFLNPPPLYVEIGPGRLQARHENRAVELPLERQPDGRLTAPCKEKVIAGLKDFLKLKIWQPRTRAFCAIGSRGVLLRRVSLPAGTKEESHQRLRLQIEGEFPLPPDELAWGCQPVGGLPVNGGMSRQELLVAAVKKEVVADYHEILRACGTEPVFTLAALARRNLWAQPADSSMMLDIGASQSELTGFDQGNPVNSRIIFWGTENTAVPAETRLDTLAQSLKGGPAGTKLIVSGDNISEDFTAGLAKSLGNGWQCEPLGDTGGEGGSAAIAGLKKFAEQGGDLPLPIRVEQMSAAVTSLAACDLKKWGVRAGALVAALLLLPYAEALLLKPHLAKRVAAFKTEVARLTVIDRELDFLRYLKQSQPPYLDALYIFSKSVPPGTHFDALSLNSHGVVSLRCAFRDGQQVADFRSKLIDSGFFANVTVEEQVPTPDRQRVNVRISAQEKPAAQLQALAASLPADEMTKDEKPAPTAPSGAMPPGMLPPGVLPPGVPPATPAMPGAPPASKKDAK
jgi:hypothetical protein